MPDLDWTDGASAPSVTGMDTLISVDDLATRLSGSEPAEQRPVVLDVRWKLGGPPGREEYLHGPRAGRGLRRPGHASWPARRRPGRPPSASGRRRPTAGRPPVGSSSWHAGRGVRRGGQPGRCPGVVAAALGRRGRRTPARRRASGVDCSRARGRHRRGRGRPRRRRADRRCAAHARRRRGRGSRSAGPAPRCTGGRAVPRRDRAADPKAGHIPGAVSAPTGANLAVDGRFLSPEDLRRRFTALGAVDGEPVGVYCGSGVTAAHQAAALAIAGFDAVLYPGSWSQWSNLDRPVATGP